MSKYVDVDGLSVDSQLHEFVVGEALEATDLSAEDFWAGLREIITDLMPRNRQLLQDRVRLQEEIDTWHRENAGTHDQAAYEDFLTRIGYLVEEPSDVQVSTTAVDKVIADVAGPQLVVPVTNARYALNAANARWGSMYDALYGTDVIEGSPAPGGYDKARGAEVVAYTRDLLDKYVPLAQGSHADSTGYAIESGRLLVTLKQGETTPLADPTAFVGYTGEASKPEAVLLRHNGLHLELQFDSSTVVGAEDSAGMSDVVFESALTTIVDFEDSVATVDAADKVEAYRNWLGLNRGDLAETFEKGGRTHTRRLNDDRRYTTPDGGDLTLEGRSVMLVRNVGHLMTTDAVLDPEGREIGEGVLDAVLTTLGALPGRKESNTHRNSRTGSIYIVKPKMHGPEEVALTVELFSRVEKLFGLPAGTLKMGLMDEERRTSANLKACIAEAHDRIVFINTGFLDRSGDEIHTSVHAGPMVRKAAMKAQPWIGAYEDLNVDVGLEVNLPGHGQIGKGMWAMTDLMADMVTQKSGHPNAGASAAWVPSPTAATLHAMHYHQVDVAQRQSQLRGTRRGTRSELLTIPVEPNPQWTEQERAEEVDNNVQSLLGYVVRWVNQGVGSSKVPDLYGTALMEDRATLRISSQLLANWLQHDIVSEKQVSEAMERIAAVVDEQNADDEQYQPMAGNFESSIAFQAARDLVFDGLAQPNGYTEPILHRRRREVKAAQR